MYTTQIAQTNNEGLNLVNLANQTAAQIKRLFEVSKSTGVKVVEIATAVAPLAFLFTSLSLESIFPGYSRIQNTISELVWGPHGWGMTAMFVIFGFVLMSLSVRLNSSSANLYLKIGVWIVFLIGLGFIMIAIFPTRAPGAANSIKSMIHLQTARGVSVAFPLACIFFGMGLPRDGRNQFVRNCTIVSGVFGLVLVSAGGVASFTDADWMGAVERAIVLNGFIWLEIIAINLLLNEFRKYNSNKIMEKVSYNTIPASAALYARSIFRYQEPVKKIFFRLINGHQIMNRFREKREAVFLCTN